METFSLPRFANRMEGVPRSFIREILKVAVSDDVISFAGGLPNKELFPLEELHQCADLLMSGNDRNILQYANTEGYYPLRRLIAARYKQKGIKVKAENILITNGSQQGLDLLAKVFINEGDPVLIEEPGYLGAIQAFSLYKPNFVSVALNGEGIDTMHLGLALNIYNPSLAYLIPNFQNPSGISYSESTRKAVVELCKDRNMFIVEDDPYGDIRFRGDAKSSFASLLPDKTILLGTFSKTVVPAFRMGWIVAPEPVMEKLIIAKQAADLHTDFFTQRLLYTFLSEYDIENHIQSICNAYGQQADAMIRAIQEYFPKEVKYTIPEGGMFLWVTLPEGCNAMELFNCAIKEKVAFVPGNPFYVNKEQVNTFRLNFSCSNPVEIKTGIQKLARVIEKCIGTKTR